jgi:CHAT domain-containing protein/tetratricopeptide (TPR) repeat protein
VEPESYQNYAITEWLPRRGRSATHERALAALAGRFEARHRDRWLRDVLASPPGKRTVQGWTALAEARQANLTDQSEDKALAKGAEAAAQLRAAGDRAGALRAELEQAYALARALRPAECLEKAAAVERSATARNYSWILGQVLLEEGTCRAQRGESGDAQRDMARSLAHARQAAYPDLELRVSGVLAEIQTSAGNLLTAWSLGREALDKYWSGPYPGIRAHQIYFNLYGSARSLGHRQTAYVIARAAAEAIAETPRVRTEATTRALAARLAVEAGWPEEAKTEFERARTLFDRLRQTKADLDYRARAELDRAESEVAAGAAAAALARLEAIRPNAEDFGSALVRIGFQQTLGEALWQSGRQPEAESAYRQAIKLTEHDLDSLRGPRERADLLLASAKAYRGLVQIHWDRGDYAGALREWEWFRAGESLPRRGEPDLDSRLRLLRNETFLAYARLPGGMVAWVFDDRGVTGRLLNVKPEELEAVASRFLRQCADPQSSRQGLERDARLLYSWLVAPLAPWLDPKRTLIIEPDGAVGAVPMQALLDENSRFLGERFAIGIASGLEDYRRRAATGPVLASGPVVAGGKVLVVADPTLGPETSRAFPPLVQTMREGADIAARFRGAVLLTREQATLAALQQHGPHAELLHFAGHGFSNAGNGGLLLAPGEGGSAEAGVLDGKRLATENWSRCRLAVLSACSTGTGESRGPVNPESLVRGMLWAGIARVVATRWNVDAEASVLFMDRFYDALLSGAGVAGALQRAALRLRENQATNHPYFWAGFQSYGTR